jgi:hypothetical protein
MRIIALSSITAVLVATGCVQDLSEPKPLETVSLRATITSDNHCTVETMGRTYTSIGQVRGVTLPTFSGALENEGWHALGCWVAMSDGTDGELVLTFSGNFFQKPFEPGSYSLRSAEKLVSVSFRSVAFGNMKLRTIDQSTGGVTVEGPLDGAKTVRVDVTAIKYET